MKNKQKQLKIKEKKVNTLKDLRLKIYIKKKQLERIFQKDDESDEIKNELHKTKVIRTKLLEEIYLVNQAGI